MNDPNGDSQVKSKGEVLGVEVDIDAMEDCVLKRVLQHAHTTNSGLTEGHKDKHTDHSDCICIPFAGA